MMLRVSDEHGGRSFNRFSAGYLAYMRWLGRMNKVNLRIIPKSRKAEVGRSNLYMSWFFDYDDDTTDEDIYPGDLAGYCSIRLCCDWSDSSGEKDLGLVDMFFPEIEVIRTRSQF